MWYINDHQKMWSEHSWCWTTSSLCSLLLPLLYHHLLLRPPRHSVPQWSVGFRVVVIVAKLCPWLTDCLSSFLTQNIPPKPKEGFFDVKISWIVKSVQQHWLMTLFNMKLAGLIHGPIDDKTRPTESKERRKRRRRSSVHQPQTQLPLRFELYYDFYFTNNNHADDDDNNNSSSNHNDSNDMRGCNWPNRSV